MQCKYENLIKHSFLNYKIEHTVTNPNDWLHTRTLNRRPNVRLTKSSVENLGCLKSNETLVSSNFKRSSLVHVICLITILTQYSAKLLFSFYYSLLMICTMSLSI